MAAGLRGRWVDEVIKGVRRLVKMGADYIKVAATGGTTLESYPNLPAYNLDELSAIVSEAHKFQKLVASHARSTEGIINSLEAGVDMLIHCSWREPDGSFKYREDVVSMIAEAGTWVNPTLYQGTRAAIREQLSAKSKSVGLTPEEQAQFDELMLSYHNIIEGTRRMAEAGVKLVTGSDCGWGAMPFDRIHSEMDLLVESGLSPMQVLLSATRDAAISVGLGDVVGTLEPGKASDVSVFQGMPQRDVNDIANVVAVFQAGRRVR